MLKLQDPGFGTRRYSDDAYEEIKVIPFNPGERALRRLRRKGRDFRGLSGGSLLLTLRGMFFSYFSDTRELNTVAGKAIPA